MKPCPIKNRWLACFGAAALMISVAHAKPSRVPVKGCTWEHAADAQIGLDAWVQRCDFGDRKIDFVLTVSDFSVHRFDADAEGFQRNGHLAPQPAD